MQPIPTDSTALNPADGDATFFEALDAGTAVARRRLVDAMARTPDYGSEAREALRLGDATSLLSAIGHQIGRADTMVAIEMYLEIARTEQASLFSSSVSATQGVPDSIAASVRAELDDVTRRLARDYQPSRLFGLIFAIERARHLLFVSHPAAFAKTMLSGRRLAAVGRLHPDLTNRLASLANTICAEPPERMLAAAQAHATYDVIQRLMRPWGGCPPTKASVDAFAPLAAGSSPC